MRKLFFLLAICLSGPALSAQEIPRVHTFPSREYGAQGQNWSVAQSEEGWMYFANSAGVLEYDGSRWEVFPLPNRQVVRAVGYARGKVFCGGFAEFGYWEKEPLDGWTYRSLSSPLTSEKARTEEIWNILATDEFVLFQSFSTIFRYDFHKVVTLQPPGNMMFIYDIGGRLLFQALGKGLYELLPGNSFRFVEGSEIFSATTVSTMIPLADGRFLVGTDNQGVFLFQNGRFSPWNNPLNPRLKKTQLNKGLALNDGGLAFGTILDGVFILDPDGALRFHLNQENGLQNNTVLSLLEDRDHNLWAGLDQGIDLVEFRSPLTYFSDRSGKTGTIYTAALYEGKLYIGTNHGVFYRDWPTGEKPFRLLEGTQGQVWELKVFDGQLLCGHNEGTFLLKDGNAYRISSITGGWKTVRHPERPDLLVQGTYNGIVIFNKDARGRWAFSHRVDGFLEPIREMLFDPAGNLWTVHAHRGLHRIRLDKEARRVAEIHRFEEDSGLPTEFNIHIAQVNDTFVIHSDTSFFVYREDSRRLERIGQLNGIPLRGNSRILPGQEGDLFFSGNEGLELYHGADRHHLEVQLAPGYENVVSLEKGTYLFCLEYGGYAVLRESDRERLQMPRKAGPVLRYAERTGKKGFRFIVACPHYTQKVMFRYRLRGYEPEWSSWGPEATREYMNLPPGDYRFEVRSDLSDAVVEYPFTIPPPWYASHLAVLLYILATAGLVWGMERLSKRRLKLQRRKLEAESLRELEKERLQMEIRSKNRELANTTMNLLRKNETLNKLKDALQKMPVAPSQHKELKSLLRLIDEHITSDNDWKLLEESFNTVHGDFFKKLKSEYPGLTPGDLRLSAYLKMNLSSKEIAQLLNLSIRGVENKRYRLRKKLGLPEEANLAEFMIKG